MIIVGDWLFVFPLCDFSLSLFCNYMIIDIHSQRAGKTRAPLTQSFQAGLLLTMQFLMATARPFDCQGLCSWMGGVSCAHAAVHAPLPQAAASGPATQCQNGIESKHGDPQEWN